jgi:hypothetical protein
METSKNTVTDKVIRLICMSIIDEINSKIENSHTSIRINIINKIPDNFKTHMIQFISNFKNALDNKQCSLELLSVVWKNFLTDYPDFNKAINNEVDKIFKELVRYYQLLTEHTANFSKQNTKTGNQNIDYLINLLPYKNITCQGISTWVFIKLLLNPLLDESIKGRIKIFNNGMVNNPNPHMFAAIVNQDNQDNQIEFVIEPWLKYVNVKINGESFEDKGFFGTLDEYKKTFDQIADDVTLKKLQTSIGMYINPCTQEEVNTYNNKLDKL